MSAVRTLTRDQLEWRVYETNARGVPGALAPSCLIFDSDAIVRRCWTFPESWAALDDDALWSLLRDQFKFPRIGSELTEAARTVSLSAALEAVPNTIATARSLTSESRVLRDSNRALREQRDALLASCHASRDAMLDAVGKYAGMLKRSGVSPETAIVLVKEAIRDGLGGPARAEEPDGVIKMDDGIAHAIKTYYAA